MRNQLCFQIILKIHQCIYVIPKSIFFLPGLSDLQFVNAQPNVELYMNLRFIKGQLFVANEGLFGVFNRLIGPGGGEISHPLTLGKCQIPRYVPGLGGTGFN